MINIAGRSVRGSGHDTYTERRGERFVVRVDLPEFLCWYERPVAYHAVPGWRRSRAARATRRAGIIRAVTGVCQVVHATTHGRSDAICANEHVCFRLGSVVEVQREVRDGAALVADFGVTHEFLPVVRGVAFGDVIRKDLDEVRPVNSGGSVCKLTLSDMG